MRPFSTFGVSPFLQADKAALQELQGIFFKLSRQQHPDMMAGLSREKQAEAEAQSARLNADYKVIKDETARLEAVARSGTVCPPRGALPPDLAAEYFELQELWAEQGPFASATQAQVKEFTKKVTDKLQQVEKKLHEIAARYPYRGVGGKEAPWGADDVKRLNEQLQEARYYRRFLEDLHTRFGSNRANPN